MNPGFWLEPWHSPTTAWLVLAAACTSIACGVPGTFLVLQRMSLTGDAMSHSVLPGIVLGFVVSGSVDSPWILAGAACSGWAAVMLVELISRKAGVREDAATGVVFTAMFSIGVILMQVFASKIDLDPDCVLFGNLETAVHGARRTVAGWEVPNIVLISGAAAACSLVGVVLTYHRLLAAAFDPMSSRLAGHAPARTQALLLGLTAWVVVAAFQSVGAIMAVALLVLPAATSLLVARRLPAVLGLVVVHSVVASVAGLYLATWAGCQMGAAVILSGAGLFVVAAVVAHRRA